MRDPKERLRDILDGIANIAVDTGIVWDVIERDLPDLKVKIEALLQQLERGP